MTCLQKRKNLKLGSQTGWLRKRVQGGNEHQPQLWPWKSMMREMPNKPWLEQSWWPRWRLCIGSMVRAPTHHSRSSYCLSTYPAARSRGSLLRRSPSSWCHVDYIGHFSPWRDSDLFWQTSILIPGMSLPYMSSGLQLAYFLWGIWSSI